MGETTAAWSALGTPTGNTVCGSLSVSPRNPVKRTSMAAFVSVSSRPHERKSSIEPVLIRLARGIVESSSLRSTTSDLMP